VFLHRFSCGWRCCAAGASVQVGEKTLGKSRLEAFSDGVIAIIITIMLLELKCRTAPRSTTCCRYCLFLAVAFSASSMSGFIGISGSMRMTHRQCVRARTPSG
jgi:hypothetical protein